MAFLQLLALTLPPSVIAIIALVIFAGYHVYTYHFFSRPIPGIPYNKSATKSPFGDLPSLLRYYKEKGPDLFEWFCLQNTTLQSPIVQVMVAPFNIRPPIVLLADYTEMVDILNRRGHEFDRSHVWKALFGAVMPKGALVLDTTPHFKAQRKLSVDTMNTAFLRDVAVPNTYAPILGLINLWKKKAELAGEDKAWKGNEDIFRAVFDAIWSVVFAQHAGVVKKQEEALETTQTNDLELSHDNKVADFPHVDNPMPFSSSTETIDSLGLVMAAPFPGWHYWLLKKTTKLGKAFTIRDRFIDKAYSTGLAAMAQGSIKKPSCAMDCLLVRNEEARKTGSAFDDATIKDDLFMLVAAGLDTTSNTFCWLMKYLGLYPSAQAKLRDAIRSALPSASSSSPPAASDIINTSIPYLDGFIEEILRLQAPAAGISRDAIVDTTILGCHIPRGTPVYFVPMGPSFNTPGFHIDEKLRTKGQRESKQSVRAWNDEDITAFKPERWLYQDDAGVTKFDPQAGPTLPFGGGIRGCFGKKYAYMQLKLLVVLLVLHFEFLEVPEEVASMQVLTEMTRKPMQCYVRLRAL